MSFGPLPQALQVAIQQNFLRHEFDKALVSTLEYRLLAEKIKFTSRLGTTVTDTRIGLMIPNILPLNPSLNTNLDNGLIAQNYTSEQYTLTINQYPQLAPDINLIDNQTTIVDFAIRNSYNLGFASAQSTERLARNALFNAYLGGNTFITTTLGAPSTTVQIDDIRGFDVAFAPAFGVPQPVSPSNPLPVYIGSNSNPTLYNIVSYTIDVVNTSTSIITGGISGTITLSTPVSVVDATAGNKVVGKFAPLVVRPNGKQTSTQLTPSDTLTMEACFASVAQLRSNGVPPLDDGFYNFYVSPQSMLQLYNDESFKILNRGVGTQNKNYKSAQIVEFLGMRFIQTTEAFVQYPTGLQNPDVVIQRPIVSGGGSILEAEFMAGKDAIEEMVRREGVGRIENGAQVYTIPGYGGYFQYLRTPLDRLAQVISQSSNWIGGYTVPTDIGTTNQQIPTANQAFYKRAVVIETA